MHAEHCTCFILPAKVLRHLAEKAKGKARAGLLDSALLSEHLRGHRSARALMGLTNIAGEKRRTIYDCSQAQTTPPRGKLVRGEGDPASSDVTVNEAYDSCGTTYDFYQQILGRNSIDNRGMRLDSYVHFGNNFNNAFWDGAEMVYGDGDQRLFRDFAKAVDVVAHELTHGVTQFTVPGGLDYVDQSGALNESISDVFGCVIKQWALKQTADEADWLIGAGIMGGDGWKALRSLKEPGNRALTWPEDDQPSTMDGYVKGGDVHTNSGIPNRAFCLAAIALGGNSWGDAAAIWYNALPLLKPDATFQDAAQATIQMASKLGARQVSAVTEAWQKVKVIA